VVAQEVLMTTNMSNVDRALRLIAGIVLIALALGLHDAGNSPASNIWWGWFGDPARDGLYRLVSALSPAWHQHVQEGELNRPCAACRSSCLDRAC